MLGLSRWQCTILKAISDSRSRVIAGFMQQALLKLPCFSHYFVPQIKAGFGSMARYTCEIVFSVRRTVPFFTSAQIETLRPSYINPLVGPRGSPHSRMR
jgi:hypothetical protein